MPRCSVREISVFYLDRPEAANAIDVATAEKLEEFVKKAVRQNDAGVIISSRHPKVFCAGGDLRAYGKMKTKAQGVAANRKIRKILTGLSTAPILVVAALEGDSIGGGCELALSCDWIVCSVGGRFLFRQVHQSLTTGWGGATRLFARVRPSVALDWLTSGRPVGAKEAFRTGLVDHVCPEGAALDDARQFLEARAPLPAPLIGEFKRLAAAKGLGEEKIFEKLWFSEGHRKVLRSLNL